MRIAFCFLRNGFSHGEQAPPQAPPALSSRWSRRRTHKNRPKRHVIIDAITTTATFGTLLASIALIIFVLLILLFFLGFFSVYIRHFADNDDYSTAEISSRPRRRSSFEMSPRNYSISFVSSRPFSSRRGLDSQAVRSLPVYRYTKEAKHRNEDCVICLSDFEKGETVKVIPHCGHVFHVACVDTWLSSYVTCPLCRSNQLFLDKDLRLQEPPGQGSIEEHDTCSDVGLCLRRCSSCSSLGQRTGLERSFSLRHV